MKKKSISIIGVASLIWVCALAAGFALLQGYSFEPGPDSRSPLTWPETSRIQHEAHSPTLIMFVHPHCPCSRASIGELAIFMAGYHNRVKAHVMFLKPAGYPMDWVETDLWESAEAIPGVTVGLDDSGIEHTLFQASTSGHTVLYGSDGQLRFTGGITGSRGHSGNNAGRDAITALLEDATLSRKQTPVFGCLLMAQGSKCASGDDACRLHQ